MALKSIRPYNSVAKDVAANFHGMQVVYFCWDKHLMFYAPVAQMLPPDMPFREVVENLLPAVYSRHPDWEKIDWSAVQWSKDGTSFTPDLDQSLLDNGITHKTAVHFQTPGLNGINGSGY